jgi:hypothetical protein
MPKTAKSDLQVVQALLSMPVGKLTGAEKSAFQGMFDNLTTGRIVRLSMRQRAWADEVYDKNDLDKERPPAKKIAVRDKSLVESARARVPFLDDQPKLPLKPPGRAAR